MLGTMFELYEELYDTFNGKSFNILGEDGKTVMEGVGIETLSRFSLMVGEKYKDASKRLLLVGRAPNGWGKSKARHKEEFAQDAIAEYRAKHFEWVQKKQGSNVLVSRYFSESGKEIVYPLANFFQYTECVLKELAGIDCSDTDEKWVDYIAWSNLYKVSPTYSRNPEGEMKAIQTAICRRILLNDIELLDPKPTHILFFTGYDDWFELFAEDFPNVRWVGKNYMRGPKKGKPYVEARGTYGSSKVVVCCRPEYRTKEELVEDIVNGFSMCK